VSRRDAAIIEIYRVLSRDSQNARFSIQDTSIQCFETAASRIRITVVVERADQRRIIEQSREDVGEDALKAGGNTVVGGTSRSSSKGKRETRVRQFRELIRIRNRFLPSEPGALDLRR